MRFLRAAKTNRKLRGGIQHHAYTEAILAKQAIPRLGAGDETTNNRSVQPGPRVGQRMTSDH